MAEGAGHDVQVVHAGGVVAGDDRLGQRAVDAAVGKVDVRRQRVVVLDDLRVFESRFGEDVDRRRAVEDRHAPPGEIGDRAIALGVGFAHGELLAVAVVGGRELGYLGALGRHLEAIENEVGAAGAHVVDQSQPVALDRLAAHTEDLAEAFDEVDLEADELRRLARIRHGEWRPSRWIAAPAQHALVLNPPQAAALGCARPRVGGDCGGDRADDAGDQQHQLRNGTARPRRAHGGTVAGWSGELHSALRLRVAHGIASPFGEAIVSRIALHSDQRGAVASCWVDVHTVSPSMLIRSPPRTAGMLHVNDVGGAVPSDVADRWARGSIQL